MPQRKTRRGKRESARLFQIAGYWLIHEEDRNHYAYCWYDPATRKVRRRTTGKTDLDDAKRWLAALVLAEPPAQPDHPDNVTLAAVRRFYFEHHVNAKDADKYRIVDRANPKRAFAYVALYLRTVANDAGIEGAPKVGHFTLARQQAFMRWCRDKHSHSCKTISTYLTYIKAAMRFAAKPRVITDARGVEREVLLLAQAPYIEDSEKEITKITGLPRSKPRGFVPTDPELAAIIDALPEDEEHEAVSRYIIMALNTWARPEAITDLSVRAQVDFERGIVDLNPPGRLQNKKVRPTIRLTDNLRGWLLYWNLDKPLVGKRLGIPVQGISSRTLKKAAMRTGIDPGPVNRYMLRHYMATRVRTVATVAVSREERAAWMGHVDPEHSTTQAWYESFDPDHL